MGVVSRVEAAHNLLAGEATDRELGIVEELMRAAVRPDPSDVAGQMAMEHLATGGKRLRARLALAATAALRGSPEIGRVWAAACEILHNATLVHDDLQDGDRVRRGAPTVWARHGAAQAINVGDLLFALPYVLVAGCDATHEVRADLLEAIGRTTAAVVRGQALEWALTQAQVTDDDAYVAAVKGKTSALFELPVYGAARIAGRTGDMLDEVVAAFRPLGVLFQMQDDILDLYGAKGRDAAGSDLREGKISVLVVEHVRLHPEDRVELLSLLALPREHTPQPLVEGFAQRFRDGGALEAALRRIDAESARVRTHPALGRESALHAIAEELVARVLEPIAHVRDVLRD